MHNSTQNHEINKNKKRRFSSPHPFAILFFIIFLAAISTYFLPAGEYDRIEEGDQTLIVQDSYESVDSNPTNFLELFESIHEGMMEGGSVVFFIFIVGGSFYIFRSTKAIEGALGSVSSKLVGKEIFLIPILMLFFGIAGAMAGLFEEVLPFILVLIPIMRQMGFDSITGTAIVIVGVLSGFTAAITNPFTIGIAQEIAELPIFSGLGIRVLFWLIFMAISITYVMLYANKIKKDPKKSIVYEQDNSNKMDINSLDDSESLSKRHILSIFVLILTFTILIVGVILFEWSIPEFSALFIVMSIVLGIVNKMSINNVAEKFVEGCQEVTVAALIVGFAYAVLILFENANTLDFIVHSLSSIVSSMPSNFAALGMYLFQTIMNYIVSSGSGQAALTMPIMTPLSDLVEVSRQTAVTAFQFGDGISNAITPTSGALLAGLAMGGIPYVK